MRRPETATTRRCTARTAAPAGSTGPCALVHVAHRLAHWSASTISTSDGGTSWVMRARCRQHAGGDSACCSQRIMTGSEIIAIAITWPATVPVMAPRMKPTMMTAVAQAAAHRAEQLAHGIEHVLGQAAALEDGAHQREERDRQQQCRWTGCRTRERQAAHERCREPAHPRPRRSRSSGRGRRARTPPESRSAGRRPAPRTSAGRRSSMRHCSGLS